MQTLGACPLSAPKRHKGIASASAGVPAPEPQAQLKVECSGTTDIILRYKAMVKAGMPEDAAFQALRGAEDIATGQFAQLKASISELSQKLDRTEQRMDKSEQKLEQQQMTLNVVLVLIILLLLISGKSTDVLGALLSSVFAA
jgi:hypothetical protein